MRTLNADLLELLPERFPTDIFPEAAQQCLAELGGNFLIFKRVSYCVTDDTLQWLGEDFDPRYVWAAHCKCTACGASFHLGYAPGNKANSTMPGVVVPEGPDGVTYPGIIYPDVIPCDSEFASTVRDGESMFCPDCGKRVVVRPVSYFRRPRKFRCMFAQVHVVADCAAVVYWMFSRSVASDADTSTVVEPFRAVVLTRERTFRHFRWHTDSRRWHVSSSVEPSGIAYMSSDGGGMMHMKRGCLVSRRVPNLDATSGEKSGLAEYLLSADDGSGFPALYLKFWAAFPSVENVVKSGWGFAVDDALCRYVIASGGRKFAVADVLQNLSNWLEPSPAKILRMSRAEVRKFAPQKWDTPKLSAWLRLSRAHVFAPGDVAAFLPYYHKYRYEGLSRFPDLLPASIGKVDRYLDKQFVRYQLPQNTGIELFADYRKMSAQLGLADNAPEIELFPPNLRAAHDRLARLCADQQTRIDAGKFLQVRDTWLALEYSDGAICTRLPLSATDLRDEGRALNHCVGSYANRHVSGQLIVFVRHARRPERPWFTLNIDVTGSVPREIQLHGYGNEFARGKVLHIPKAVRAFCDKWKQDVLLPAFAAVRNQKAVPQ